MKLNQLPPEILLEIGEYLTEPCDIKALYNTGSIFRLALCRLVWSHVTITADTPNSNSTLIRVTPSNLKTFIISEGHKLVFTKSLSICCDDLSVDKVVRDLSAFTNVNTLHLTATVSKDKTIDTLHKIQLRFESAHTHTLDVSINYDWCAPDSPLITPQTKELTLRNSKCNDFETLLDNLGGLPSDLTTLRLKDESHIKRRGISGVNNSRLDKLLTSCSQIKDVETPEYNSYGYSNYYPLVC